MPQLALLARPDEALHLRQYALGRRQVGLQEIA
jgi:hypothetical protein